MTKNQLGFRSLHPVCAFLFFIFTFTVSMASSHPLLLSTNLVCAVLCDFVIQGKKGLRLFLCVLLPMMVLISALNGLYNHYGVTVLFVMRSGNNFTLEALIYGLVFAVKVCTAVLWLDVTGDVLQSDKVIYLFGRLSPRLALVISMVLRFLPLIRRQSAEIIAAQKGLGAVAGAGVLQKIRSAAHRLSILISWTLERGIDTADSMRARGYGLRRRSFYNRFVFSPSDLFCLLITAAAFLLYLFSLKGFASIYNPAVCVPFPSVFGWFAYFMCFIALLLPLFVDFRAKKMIRVKYE